MFKKNKWIRSITGINYLYTSGETITHKGDILWVPKVDEMCVFYSKHEDGYFMARYRFYEDFAHYDEFDRYFDDVAPLEFALTLK